MMQYFENKRYYTFNNYLKRRFGAKVWKIPVHAPFTCPNRDGTVGTGGCVYCRNEAFCPDLTGDKLSIAEQVREGMARVKRKRKVNQFLVYFQSYTNTYADIERLRTWYDAALESDEVVGLAIGTRPDCISPEILDLLESYASRVEVWLEYGLQSSHDRTLKLINRGHTVADFQKAIDLTQLRNIKICVHVIVGLPGESREEILATAKYLAMLPIHGVKIHPIQVHRQTVLEQWYHQGEVPLLTLPEYVQLCCDYLERLSPEFVIQRLTAEAPAEILVAPEWCLNKMAVLNTIDAELERRGSWQGKLNAEFGMRNSE